MVPQFREIGNYRTSTMKLVFCGKLMNYLLPMTRKKSTCLCPYVMNFYEVKFAVYKKYTLSCCRCKIIEFRLQSNVLLQRQSLAEYYLLTKHQNRLITFIMELKKISHLPCWILEEKVFKETQLKLTASKLHVFSKKSYSLLVLLNSNGFFPQSNNPTEHFKLKMAFLR